MITNIFQFLKMVNQRQFLLKLCGLNPLSGVNHRIINKPTNKSNYNTSLREGEKADLRKGLKEFGKIANDLSELPDEILFKRDEK